MLKRIMRRWTSLALTAVMVLSMLPAMTLSAAAAETIVEGLEAEGDFSEITGGIKIEATSTGKTDGCGGSDAAPKNASATLTNTRDVAAKLSFDYTVSIEEPTSGYVKIDNEAQTADGHFEQMVDSRATVNIEVFSGTPEKAYTGTYTSKIEITNISLAVDKMVTTTFQPAENGSYTVDSAAVTTKYSHTKNATETTSLVAVPAEGYIFLGWYSQTAGKLVSLDKEWTTHLTDEQTIEAWFALATAPVFQVGTDFRSPDLNAAVNFAATKGPKTVVLIQDGTLPAGDYTIPGGVTLLIPFDEAHTLRTTTPEGKQGGYGAVTAFSTLTMARGAKITVNGAISVGGRVYATTPYTGVLSGPYGCIKMESGSSITLKSGANLYCWGYIMGQGSVTAESGATVYEDMQVRDFRGGNASLGLLNNSQKVFLFNQYYVHNVQVPLTINAGAADKIFTATTMTGVGYTAGDGTLIGSDGLFRLDSGSITKRYDGATDRTIVDLNGAGEISVLSVKVGVNISTSSYVMPIASNMTLNVNSGSLTLSEDQGGVVLLPSAELNVAQGAKMIVDSGAALYVYDKDQWGSYSSQGQVKPLDTVPGRTGTRTAASLTDAKLDVNGMLTVNGALYTTEGGANIISSQGTGKVIVNQEGEETITYQATQSGTSLKFVEIPITPAKLKNNNEGKEGMASYTQTSGAAAGDKFVYSEGVWHKSPVDTDENGEHYPHVPVTSEDEAAKEPTCTEPGLAEGSHCEICGKVLVEQEEIPALGHDYGDPVFEWFEEGGDYYVVASRTCKREGCTDEINDHTQKKTIRVDSSMGVVIKEPGCEETGVCRYSVTCWDVDYQKDVDIKKLGHRLSLGWDSDEANHWRNCQNGCGYKGNEGEHTWSEGTVTKEPGCTETGVKTFECTVCHEEKTEVILTLGHSYRLAWGEWTEDSTITASLICQREGCVDETAAEVTVTDEVTTKPTCAAEGGKTYTATVTVNGEALTTEKVVVLPKVDHTPGESKTENVKGAACAAPGTWDEVVYCSVCKEELSRESKSGEALGHNWDEGKITRAATCIEVGEKTYTCSRCGETEAEEIAVDAANHANVVTDAAKAPTCTETGLTAGSHCEACYEVITAQETVEKKAHTAVTDQAVTPTCTETGLTEGKHCSVCEAVLIAQKVVPANGHTENTREENRVAATCAAPGSYDEVVYCTVCGAELSRASKSIGKLSHSLEETAAKAATCETAGNVAYWTCTVCKQIFSDEAGVNLITEKDTVIEAPGHTEAVDAAVAATCTKDGKTEGKHCSVCNKVLVKQETVKANGHAEVTISGKAAACTESGLTDGTECSVCGEIVKEQRELKALGHSYTGAVTAEAGCEDNGVRTFTCERCGDSYIEDIPAVGHKYGGPVWGEWKEDGDGYTIEVTFTCASCDDVQKPKVTVTSETVEATCTEDGETVYTATVEFEDKTYEEVKDKITISAEGHVYGEPKWEWDGLDSAVATFTCIKCEVEVQTVEGEATENKVPATCTKEGSVAYTVTVTFNERDFTVSTEPETIDATGHMKVTDEAVAATCTEDGLTKGSHCAICGEVLVEREVISATGHSWDDGVVTTEPGCETVGVKTYTCQNDEKHTHTEILEAVGHSLTDVEAKAPVCAEAGYSAYEVCEVCGKEFGKEAIPAAGHKYGEPEFVWARNDQGGWTAEAVFSCEDCKHQRSVNAGVSVSSETSATCTESGLRALTAEAEGFTAVKEVELPALGHTEVTDAAVAATCEGTGLTEGSHCSVCGEVLTPRETILALGHDYEENWTWTADNQAKLALVCKRGATHVENLDAAVEVVETPATVSAPGSRVYTATVKLGDVEYTNSKTEIIPRLTPAPSGGGGGGGGGGSAKPEPPVEVVDPDVPLVEQPGGATVTVSEPVKDPETGEITVEVEVKTDAPVSGGATVSIPVEGAEAGIVAVLVGEDGSETVVRKSVVTNGNILNVPLEGSAVICVRNNAKKFEDVPDTLWSAKAVAFVSSHELFNGTGEGIFSPTENMSRAMVATVLHNLENNPAARQAASFQDVAPGKWYSDSIAWASENNVVSGYSSEAFGVNDNVTRQDLVVMLWRYAGRPDVEDGCRLDFTDAEDVSGYAETAMCWAVRNGIINGKGGGVLDPLGNATRQEVAQILQNFLENTAK